MLIPGKPPLAVMSTKRIGGRWDCVLRRFSGAPTRWIVWHVSERQAAVILDEDPVRTRTLLYSAEGGGKTVTGAMWAIAQVIRLATVGVIVAGGATAPTHERLQTLVKAVRERIPTDDARTSTFGSIATYYADAREMRFVTGHVLQFRSTKKQSTATGSPVQGFTWGFSLDDELQDTVENGADPDIEARLRGARISRRLGTATAKDSPNWRTFRDSKLSTPDWGIERIRYDENPFVWSEHWDRMQRNMSPREWRRRGLALDVGPERMLYYRWERGENLRPIPQIGATDVTRTELAGYGRNLDLLIGYDPGKRYDVSVMLKAYRVQGSGEIHWWVVDELTTEQSTTEHHVLALVARVRAKWGCNLLDLRNRPLDGSPMMLVRADPTGNTEDKPDLTVYTVFKQHGIDIRPAAYAPVVQGKPVAPKHGRIGKEARIDLVNTLLGDARGVRRLFVNSENGVPVAPRLVESLELSERDVAYRAEIKDKHKPDLTHWTTSLGYALWAVEKPRLMLQAPARGVG